MVHVRLNEREPNPNPHVNFITPLPSADPAVQEDARQLLRALAAQVRPVMKAHGFAVNSLEEVQFRLIWMLKHDQMRRRSMNITGYSQGETGTTERLSVSMYARIYRLGCEQVQSWSCAG